MGAPDREAIGNLIAIAVGGTRGRGAVRDLIKTFEVKTEE
jgi:hypothetical protein